MGVFLQYLIVVGLRFMPFELHNFSKCSLDSDPHYFEPAGSGVDHGESHEVYWRAVFTFKCVRADKVDT